MNNDLKQLYDRLKVLRAEKTQQKYIEITEKKIKELEGKMNNDN